MIGLGRRGGMRRNSVAWGNNRNCAGDKMGLEEVGRKREEEKGSW